MFLISLLVFHKSSIFFFQNVFLEHMVSTVNPAAIHVSTICVTDMTDSVHNGCYDGYEGDFRQLPGILTLY